MFWLRFRKYLFIWIAIWILVIIATCVIHGEAIMAFIMEGLSIIFMIRSIFR